MSDASQARPSPSDNIGTTKCSHKHSDWVYAVAWSPDKKAEARIASAGRDKTIQIWDASEGLHPVTYREHTNRINSVAWSPDNRYLASAGEDGTVRIHEVAVSKEICCLREHGKPVKTVAWSPDGQFLASGGNDTIVRIWKLVTKGKKITGFQESYFQNHEKARRIGGSGINAIAWSPDSTLIASAGDDKTIRVWKVFSSQEIFPPYSKHHGRINTISWSCDGLLIASGGDDKCVHIWEAKTGEQTQVLPEKRPTPPVLVPHESPPFDAVLSVAWSPDGQKLALASYKVVHLFGRSKDSINCFYTYKEHSEWVRTLAWSPDSNSIASAGDDKYVLVWSAMAPHTGPLDED